MIRMIVNLGSKKGENRDNSYPQITRTQNSLPMPIVENPEKDLYNDDRKYDMRKVRTSSVKSSSTLFSCSIRAMYNDLFKETI